MRATACRFATVGPLALALGLAGCGLLGSTPSQLFDLSPKTTFEDGLPTANWQLVVEEPTAPKEIDSDRIAIKPQALEIEYLPDVRWTDRAPALVQTRLVESFESSNKIVGVGRRAVGLTGDYILNSELREFEAVSNGPGQANVLVRLVLKLVRQSSGAIIAATTIEENITSASDKPGDLVVAFDQGLGKVLKRTVIWTLTQGSVDRKRALSSGG